jgi:hypothetical protein
MNTNNFPRSAVGWMAIVTGVSAILAALFLLLMYTVEPSFGRLNDILNAILGVASGLLVWMLYPHHRASSPLLSGLALVLALVGVIFTLAGSVLIVFDVTGYVLAGFYTAVGNALIGVWLAAFCRSALRKAGGLLPHNLARFGLVVGAIMALGVLCIPGILAGVDAMGSLPWYLLGGFFGFLGTYLFYPIWTLWFGRRMTGEERSR